MGEAEAFIARGWRGRPWVRLRGSRGWWSSLLPKGSAVLPSSSCVQGPVFVPVGGAYLAPGAPPSIPLPPARPFSALLRGVSPRPWGRGLPLALAPAGPDAVLVESPGSGPVGLSLFCRTDPESAFGEG